MFSLDPQTPVAHNDQYFDNLIFQQRLNIQQTASGSGVQDGVSEQNAERSPADSSSEKPIPKTNDHKTNDKSMRHTSSILMNCGSRNA